MMYYYIGQCNFILRLMISYCPIWFYIAPSEITLSLINKYASYHCYWAIWPYMASFEIRIRLIISSYPTCFYIAFCEIILFFLFNIDDDDDDDDDDDNDYDQRGFCGMVDQRKTFSLIFSLDHCRQRFSQSWISDTPSRIWTCAEPEFRLCWMELCSSDTYITALLLSQLSLLSRSIILCYILWTNITSYDFIFPNMNLNFVLWNNTTCNDLILHFMI